MTRRRAACLAGLILLLGACTASRETASEDLIYFPEGEIEFWNLGGSEDPRIVDVFCCSPEDNRIVILFESGTAEPVGRMTATLSVVFEHTRASGREVLSWQEDVTRFVEEGEVRTGLQPTYPGTYRATIEFFRNGRRFAMVNYLQVREAPGGAASPDRI